MKSLKNLALLPVLFASPMFGGHGVFDALDPCIEARKQFQQKKDATLESVANRLAQINVEDARNKRSRNGLPRRALTMPARGMLRLGGPKPERCCAPPSRRKE